VRVTAHVLRDVGLVSHEEERYFGRRSRSPRRPTTATAV
jgi:hypothetical protein